MTDAQLAATPRPLCLLERTPETPPLKGTEEEFQAKVETTKTAASTKRKKEKSQRKEETWSTLW